MTTTTAPASPGIEQPTRPLLTLSGIYKSFPGVDALKDVSFAAAPGEVHALLGENGAGKSTLMAIASGAIEADAGTISFGDEPVGGINPALAQEHGLAIVRQRPALLPDLTVAENIKIAIPGEVRRASGDEREWMATMLERVGCRARPSQRVEEVSVAQRQLIELGKALAIEPRILILDEPTAPLGADMVEQVMTQVRSAAARGAAVIYISHRLVEVRQIADRVTVMRDGEVRGSGLVDEMSDERMLQLIVGRKLEMAFPDKNGSSGAAPALEVENLSGDGFHGVDLSVGSNEIVGLAGIAGNGQADLLRSLAGLQRSSGDVVLGGRRLRLGSARAAADAGIFYLSADRHSEGLVRSLSVRENAALSVLSNCSRFGIVDRRAEARMVVEQRDALDIRTASLEAEIESLSGGNQQKVLLARALLSRPSLVLADEPTQGVDAGARVEIYRQLRELAEKGIPVLVVSSDSLELEGLCDRVAVFSRGQVVGELTDGEVTEEGIARAIVTATTHREEGSRRGEADEATSTDSPAGAAPEGRRVLALGERVRAFAKGDYAPALVLALVMVALGAYTYGENDRVLSSLNLTSVLTLLSALAFIAFGQLVVILTGGIDLSVGPLAGLTVVIASFFVVAGNSPVVIVLGFVVMLTAAAITGAINGSLVRFGRFVPIAATLATFIALQGVSLLLRPEQEGIISGEIAQAVEATIGTIPVAFIVAVALAIGLEYGLRQTKWGLGLRATGSRREAAHVLGVNADRTILGAYVVAALLTFLGGVMLMAQIGVGDPTQGVEFTLSSITAVVLGGASLFGGRGSFIGALLGAALIQQTINATTFLELSQSWQFFIVGFLVLIAAGIYTQARRAGQRRVAA